ncbi:hypothetical protein Daus18300_010745 [Diaporthe australafricana]|uniref:Protein kinase domain-containing protein n=1 Tax=Diaporthe australafricana TaxID=127596 RepID=A0ABR3W987_9PEZI
MVEVVKALHDNKHIIHGDVKLENMLLDAEGHVKLCDVEEGLFEDEDEEIWEGNVTWHYVSPNRRRREEDLGHDAPPRKEDDLYGLGLSIWSLCTGQVPFERISKNMATNIGPVTELVRIPLAVPFEPFLSTFTSELEPVLLAQPGIVSILTGVIVPTDGQNGAYAVSITQWEDMEAHGAFLESPAAKPFFETLQPLATGPPAIEHYWLGRLNSTALGSHFAHVSIFDCSGTQSFVTELLARHVNSPDGGRRVGVAGSCIEVKEQGVLILFSDGNNFETVELGGGRVTSFVVRIERARQKITSPRSESANL